MLCKVLEIAWLLEGKGFAGWYRTGQLVFEGVSVRPTRDDDGGGLLPILSDPKSLPHGCVLLLLPFWQTSSQLGLQRQRRRHADVDDLRHERSPCICYFPDALAARPAQMPNEVFLISFFSHSPIRRQLANGPAFCPSLGTLPCPGKD